MGGENKNASIRKKILFIRGNTFTRENQPRERKTSGLETLTKTKCEAKICKLKQKMQCLKALPAKIIHNLTTQLYARENMVREFNNKHFAKLQFFVPHKKEASFHHPFPLFLCFGSTTLVLLPPPATSTHYSDTPSSIASRSSSSSSCAQSFLQKQKKNQTQNIKTTI